MTRILMTVQNHRVKMAPRAMITWQTTAARAHVAGKEGTATVT